VAYVAEDDIRLVPAASLYQANVAPEAPDAVSVVLLPLQINKFPVTDGAAGWADTVAAIRLNPKTIKIFKRIDVNLCILKNLAVNRTKRQVNPTVLEVRLYQFKIAIKIVHNDNITTTRKGSFVK